LHLRKCRKKDINYDCVIVNMPVEGFGPDVRSLIILIKHVKIKRSDLQTRYGMNYNVAKSALERLENLGLVLYEVTGDRYDTVYYSLTEKGRKVAQKLEEIDEIILNG